MVPRCLGDSLPPLTHTHTHTHPQERGVTVEDRSAVVMRCGAVLVIGEEEEEEEEESLEEVYSKLTRGEGGFIDCP